MVRIEGWCSVQAPLPIFPLQLQILFTLELLHTFRNHLPPERSFADAMASFRAIGLLGLINDLGVAVPPPAVWSCVWRNRTKDRTNKRRRRGNLPSQYACESLTDNLRFALRCQWFLAWRVLEETRFLAGSRSGRSCRRQRWVWPFRLDTVASLYWVMPEVCPVGMTNSC